MPRATATSLLESGRLAYARSAWAEAHEQLTAADRSGRDSVERGYLALIDAHFQAQSAEWEAAVATARESAETAERHGDADLLALSLMDQGHYLLRLGQIDGGVRLLDEAMVAVTVGELSPVVTGLVYRSVIDGRQEASELRRAQEWTTSLTRWCDEQVARHLQNIFGKLGVSSRTAAGAFAFEHGLV